MATKSDLAESVADLKSLYNVEATFEYTSRAGLVRALRTFPENRDRIRDYTVLITRFPSQMSDIECGDPNSALPHKGKSLYFRDRKILIFTMAGSLHEILCRALYTVFYEKLKKMNCQENLIARGGATESLKNLNKDPDESWGPRGVPYATLVLEVGMAESLRALDVDAQRWIKNELSHVTQVLTAKIYPHRREIIFAVWWSTNGRQPKKKYEVHVERRQGRPRVVGNNRSLHLILEKILERPPAPGTSEREIIFTARELCTIALKVWEEMDIQRRG